MTLLRTVAGYACLAIGAAYLLMFPVVWAALFLAGRYGKDHDRRQP